MFVDPETGELTNGIKRVNYTHDALVDILIARPEISQREIASIFGYTEGWVSTMTHSDAFQGRLAERKKELVDPQIIKSIEERFKAVADLSLRKVLERLEKPSVTDDFLLGSLRLSGAALGYGARQPGATQNVNNGVVINMPGVAPSAEAWGAKYRTAEAPQTIEMEPVKATPIIDHENPQIAVRR